MPTAADLRSYAADPMRFFVDSFAAAGLTMADFQRERFASLALSLVAVALDQKPAIGRFSWCSTKGSAKDSDLALILLWLSAFARHPISGMIGAADAEQAGEILRAVKAWLRVIPWLVSRVRVQSDSIVCDDTDTKVAVVAADVAGGAHGRRDHITIINELSHISDARFEAPRTWMDNADKMPWGIVIQAMNAGFIDTEAYKWYEIARTSSDWSFHEFNQPAPWLSEKHLAEASRRNPPERFARLFHGVWSHGTGNCLDIGDIQSAIVAAGPHTTRALNCDSYIASIDLGIKHDRSAFIACGIDATHQRVELAWARSWSPADYNGRIPLEDVKAEVLRVHRELRFDGVLYDPWQAELLAEQLAAAGLRMIPCPATPANLDLMARELLEGFRNRLIKLYDDSQLIRDLYRLSITERAIGYRLEAKRTKNDHADSGFAFAQILPTAFAWAKEIEQLRLNAIGPTFTSIYDDGFSAVPWECR